MKLHRVELLTVWYAPRPERRIRVGRLARRRGEILFEFGRDFVRGGLELSPFTLPLQPGVVAGDPARFEGLKGLFEDSLPDGWGRLLVDRRSARCSGARASTCLPTTAMITSATSPS